MEDCGGGGWQPAMAVHDGGRRLSREVGHRVGVCVGGGGSSSGKRKARGPAKKKGWA
jgi:hypothetical protein